MEATLLLLLVLGGAAALSWPLGQYVHRAMDPAPDTAGRVDRWLVAAVGRGAAASTGWRAYLASMLWTNFVMYALVYSVLLLQGHLPLNPDGRPGLAPDLAFHTAASFVTNTDLQHYSGEAALSHLGQLSLLWLQFVSAGTGLAVFTALARALAGREQVGAFHVDLLRATCLVLLPFAVGLAALLALGGVPMTFEGAAAATTLEGATQTICRGPVAAFVAIKQLGTNGGGFFGPNSAHPFENPGFWTNVLSTVAIVVLPMAQVWTFGHIVGRMRHAVVLFVVMGALLLGKLGFAMWAESAPTAAFAGLPIAHDVANLEGKELRFGAAAAPLWAVLTTCTSNGSVNCMHDSLNPLTGLAPFVGMWLNATFGGVGVGLINLFVHVVLAVFLAGAMVGRTPEYLSRRVEVREVKLAVLAVFAHALLILAGAAVFSVTAWGTATTNNPGPHGFSEILYEFTSAAANNGSGFEGLGDGTVPWNAATGLAMLFGRYVPIVLPLAIAGSLAKKRATATSAGTLGVDGVTFGVMLVATIVILGALTFLPAAALGPLADHLTTNR